MGSIACPIDVRQALRRLHDTSQTGLLLRLATRRLGQIPTARYDFFCSCPRDTSRWVFPNGSRRILKYPVAKPQRIGSNLRLFRE